MCAFKAPPSPSVCLFEIVSRERVPPRRRATPPAPPKIPLAKCYLEVPLVPPLCSPFVSISSIPPTALTPTPAHASYPRSAWMSWEIAFMSKLDP